MLISWEESISRYEHASGERISQAIKCATALGYGPKAITDLCAVPVRRLGTATQP